MKVRYIKQIIMVNGNIASFTVGKVYETTEPFVSNSWFQLWNDKGSSHSFNSLESPRDSYGFKTSDHWELVE